MGNKYSRRRRHSVHPSVGKSSSDGKSPNVRILEGNKEISVELRSLKGESGVFVKCESGDQEVYLLRHIGNRVLAVGDTDIETLSKEGQSISFNKSGDTIFDSKTSVDVVSVTVKNNGSEEEIATHTVS